jgi:hypothetical protein
MITNKKRTTAIKARFLPRPLVIRRKWAWNYYWEREID